MALRIQKLLLPLFVALALSASAVVAQDRDRDQARDPAADQDRDRDRDRIADRDRAGDQDRIADRDRTADRAQDRLQDRDQDRLRDPDQDRDQGRDRLRLHVDDQDQLRLRDIYGAELMSRQERRQYRDRIQSMDGVQEWARYRAEHQRMMMERAREQGTDLPEPLYGQQLMTDRERIRLRERLQEATGSQERERILAQHREQMQERARANNIPLDEL